MLSEMKGFFYKLSLAILLLLIAFSIYQIFQMSYFLYEINKYLGIILGFILSCIFLYIVVTPIYKFVSMPKKLQVPEDVNSTEYQQYLQETGKRLTKNKTLMARSIRVNPEDASSVESAVAVLDIEARKIIKENALKIFITTAVSQHGRLDGLIVLYLLMRQVMQISKLYNQSPAINEIMSLYYNVFLTAFIAYGMEESSVIEEQLEPLLTVVISNSLAESAISAVVPGTANITGLLLSSSLEGAANSFLAIRVGLITSKHCSISTKKQQKTFNKDTYKESFAMLKETANKAIKIIRNAIFNSAKNAGLGFFWKNKNNIELTEDAGAEQSKHEKKTVNTQGTIRQFINNITGKFT